MSIFGNVSAAGGFDQSEIDFVTQLISSGQTTIDEVSKTFGVPTDVIASVYAENAPKFASPAPIISAPAPAITLTPTPTANNQNSLINDIITANNILGSIGNIYGNATVAPAAPVSNQGYQSPYALNAAEPSNVNLGQVAGGTNTALQGLSDFNIADSAGSAAAASDVFAGGLGSVIGAVSGQESKAETAGLTLLSAINPAAALAYRIVDAMDLFGGGGLKETPMTEAEAATYAAESRLASTLQGQGEGAGELILDAVEQANAANEAAAKAEAAAAAAAAADAANDAANAAAAAALAEAQDLSVNSVLSNIESEYEDLSNTLRTDDGFIAGTAPVFTGGDTQVKNVGDEYYDQFTQDELAAMNAANAAVLDVPLNVAQGALMGTEMLTNVAGADNVASQTLGEWQDVLGGMMSEQSKLDKAEISSIMSEAEGTGAWNEIKAAAEAFGVAPIDFVSNALGTTLPVIAATAVSGGGILPATAVGAATGVGTAKGAIYDATKQEMLNQGMTEEQANQVASDAQSYGGENLGEILISGGFGALAGSTGVEASVSRILQGLGKGGTATVIKGAAGESLGEFGEGGAEQYATNKALQELGLDITDFQGVIGNATLESLAGAATGGGISAIEAAGEGGIEGIADTGNNLQLVKDFNEAYNRNLESLSNNVESLTTTGLENELTSNTLGSEITGLEDTSGAATRDLNTSPKSINEVTTTEINEIESAIEESGLVTQTTGQTTAQQNANTVAGLSTVANKAIGMFGVGAAAIAAVVYAANKSGASAAQVAAATNMSVEQVNNLAAEAGQTINNQAAADTTADTIADTTADTITSTTGNTFANTVTNANASTAINNAASSSLSSGADINTTVNNTVTTAINNGVTTNTAVSSSVNSAVTTSINSGANVSTVIDTAVTSAINSTANANGDVNSAINSAVNSAINSAVNSGANVNVATNTAVNAAINAAVNAGVNIVTATNIANNAATNTNINNNVNPNVNPNINPNVNPNINANPNTNINQEVPDPESPEKKREGLMQLIQSTPLTESILFQPKFTELDNVQLGMFERFLRAAGGR